MAQLDTSGNLTAAVGLVHGVKEGRTALRHRPGNGHSGRNQNAATIGDGSGKRGGEGLPSGSSLVVAIQDGQFGGRALVDLDKVIRVSLDAADPEIEGEQPSAGLTGGDHRAGRHAVLIGVT